MHTHIHSTFSPRSQEVENHFCMAVSRLQGTLRFLYEYKAFIVKVCLSPVMAWLASSEFISNLKPKHHSGTPGTRSIFQEYSVTIF